MFRPKKKSRREEHYNPLATVSPENTVSSANLNEQTTGTTSSSSPRVMSNVAPRARRVQSLTARRPAITAVRLSVPNNVVTTAQVEEEVKNTLRMLRKSKGVREASDAIMTLEKFDCYEDYDEDARLSAAQTIFRNGGIGAILLAFEKYHSKSDCVAEYAIRTLVCVSNCVQESVTSIINFGGLQTAMAAATSKKLKLADHNGFRSHLIGLVANLSSTTDLEAKLEVATEDCVDFVISTMKKWPNDTYVQKEGCSYFLNISTLNQDIRTMVRGKRVLPIIGAAMETLGEDDRDYKIACQVMAKYASTDRQKPQLTYTGY
eukprot:scaffold2708_cov119-Cylindrotheca_fusiformis.AAC.8